MMGVGNTSGAAARRAFARVNGPARILSLHSHPVRYLIQLLETQFNYSGRNSIVRDLIQYLGT